MATEKILIFDEAGNAKRMKVRIARFLDNEPVTASDKTNIRTTLDVDDSLSGTFTTPLSVTSASDSSFTGGGKVGIGGSPSEKLSVSSSNTGRTGVSIDNTSTGGRNYIIGSVGSATDGGAAAGSFTIRDGNASANRVIIDSSGNVSIGAGDVANNGSLHVYRSSATADLNLQSAGGSGRSYALQSKADGNLVIRDNNAAADRWYINSSGNLVANSTGIDFGSVAGGTGTPAADGGLLNDFERGSFTPSFTSTGTAPTLTYLAQVGTYTKVGNLVTCHGRVRVNAVTGAGTGSLQISGLPFATQNVSNLGSGGAVCLAAFFGTSSSGCPTHLSGANNATVMTFKTLKNSAGVVASLDNTDAADLANSCYVDFSITYTTA